MRTRLQFIVLVNIPKVGCKQIRSLCVWSYETSCACLFTHFTTCSSPVRCLGRVLPRPDWKQTPSSHLGAWFIGVTAVTSGFKFLPVYAALWEWTWGLRRCWKEAAASATNSWLSQSTTIPTIQQWYKNFEICSANRSSTSKLWQQLQSSKNYSCEN